MLIPTRGLRPWLTLINCHPIFRRLRNLVASPTRSRKLNFSRKLWINIDHPRFVPYVQLHEFEALLFSDPKSFSIAFPSIGTQLSGLEAIRRRFETPEHIDEREDLAPSKRILGLLPDYDKPVSGPLIAKQIGLAKLRQECHHFDTWLTRLEEPSKAATC